MISPTERVAIVSLGIRFPGAGADPQLFWQDVASASDRSKEVPAGRWFLPPEKCLDPRIANPDTVYTSRGYYLDPFEPDLSDLNIDRQLAGELDPLFHMILDAGNRAWRNAKTEQIDRSRVGVVLGNICLPTGKSNTLCREILGKSGVHVHPWNRFVAGLPAGVLAKSLGLGGGSFTLDAACASSLYAIKLAADELLAGRADAMLAGGANGSDPQYTQMGFAQLRALSPSGQCSPFDQRADGLMVGEGAGVFVLKRFSDALKHGDKIWAVIAGVGLSNDMHGNLLAPAKEGQLRAMRKAYERAGWKPQDVDVIECHATGTPVGDAVEFESLREFWGEAGWEPGRCAIGSVKSTVGHFLTGAGAAATAKVLLAMANETLPPQANFGEAAEGLRYANGPFRVLNRSEPWNRRAATEPRRAAVSGFGFGGVNAHLLLEEWTGLPPRKKASPTKGKTAPKLVTAATKDEQPKEVAPPPVPIAVVGMAAHFGPWLDLRMFQERVLGGDAVTPAPKVNGWGLASEQCPPGYFIEEMHFPIDRFRIPPKELEETLPQQLLMLQVAATALDDCRTKHEGDDPTTGAFIGLGLDLNTTNFHLRWAALVSEDSDSRLTEIPPLTANRTMGALGSIAASRIARAFHFGGPSHTVCSEEASAARAFELGVRALQQHEIDRALVGGGDLAGDPRCVLPGTVALPGEGAAAFVLKRLDDAERDGDRVYAVIRNIGVADSVEQAAMRAGIDFSAVGYRVDSAERDVGNAGAASAAASLAKACLALYQEVLPGDGGPPRYWLHDTATGPRRAGVTATGADGSCFVVLLEDYTTNAQEEERFQPLGARGEALFTVEGDTPHYLLTGLDLLRAFTGDDAQIEALARGWFQKPHGNGKLAASFVARSAEELREQLAFAAESLRSDSSKPFNPPRPAMRDRVFYSPQPLGRMGKLALVFPGSGNQFDGMGRDLATQFPHVIRRQQAENELLRSQFAPEWFWGGRANDAPHRDLMFGQVTVGALVSDIAVSLGVKVDAMIGISLGESAGLFGIRAWKSRDEMYCRMHESTLFNSDLAPPYNAARTHWGLPPDHAVEWVSGVIPATAEDVLAALRTGLKAYLLIENTPGECVIGGKEDDVQKLAAAIGKPLTKLSGVTLAHCDAGRPVEVPYRELHTLPVTLPPGITVYSSARGRSYIPTDEACAESITAGLMNTIKVPAVIEAAYRDGVRAFIEVGPGASCTRMIDAILGDRPRLARAAHAPRQDAYSQILRLLAHLIAERFPVDLTSLYGQESQCVGHREVVKRGPELVIPVGLRPSLKPDPTIEPEPVVVSATPLAFTPLVEMAANVQVGLMEVQETYLRVNQRFIESAASLIQFQTALLARMGSPALASADSGSRLTNEVPRALSLAQCNAFAAGRVADALGLRYTEIDAFPTRVRLPDGPLQLVDQITLIEGEPLSMTRGRCVTTHTVRADRWYLEASRIPTAIAVESGQADLFLSGFLGIDFQTRGLAVYRLLDAVVSFHRGLPQIGETITYDIHIDGFVKQGDAWIFRFRFDGTVNGEPFITMRNGVAGFFTAARLAEGKGIVQTALDRQQLPGKRPDDWRDFVPLEACSLDHGRVESLRRGDLVAAFGDDFANVNLRRPQPLPGGMLRLVDRVPLMDPSGGRFGIGFVRAEFGIHPDDWFLTCHFVDDMVMPGTLMYECCLHTLRILLMRMGWVGEDGEVVCEPVPGVNSRLKCRGQVIASTRMVTYEITVKELGYQPEPFCIADALMYADGKPIVEITNMCLRMTGTTREKLEEIWATQRLPVATGGLAPFYDSASILAFSNGNPSEAFGEPYRVFDSERKIARLPGPPFQFLDRVVAVMGEPFVLKAGAACETEYDVPADAWYFAENRSENMPFSVLLEIALQPCGWLAAYCGSALTSSEDLKFRNLGGKATQFRAVTRDGGRLTVNAKMTNVSQSAGMIIQHFDMKVSDRAGTVYEGTTYFGFFSAPQLANQVGIREAKVPWPNGRDVGRAERGELPREAPFPSAMMRMIDRIETYLPVGGEKGLGLVVGRVAVDPGFWFFQAHFYQDPVWPGSLGLESFLQLLKYAAWRRWGEPKSEWLTVALNKPHAWTYRGQVIPTDKEVTVLLEVTKADEANRQLTANGFLTVDGRVIYQMTDFTLE